MALPPSEIAKVMDFIRNPVDVPPAPVDWRFRVRILSALRELPDGMTLFELREILRSGADLSRGMASSEDSTGSA